VAPTTLTTFNHFALSATTENVPKLLTIGCKGASQSFLLASASSFSMQFGLLHTGFPA
jgi:hypothetical protein